MVEGFVEWTRARGGSASTEDLPRTSLRFAVLTTQSGLTDVVLRPGRVHGRHRQTEAKLGVTTRRVPWCKVTGRA